MNNSLIRTTVVILLKGEDRNQSDCVILFSSNSKKLFVGEIAGVAVQTFEQVNELKEVDECVFVEESRMLFGCVTVGLGEGLDPEKENRHC